MSTLTEIEAAAESLPPEQKLELLQFLAVRLRPADLYSQTPSLVRQENDARLGAKLVVGPEGTMLLQAPAGAPPMTTEIVKALLEDFP